MLVYQASLIFVDNVFHIINRYKVIFKSVNLVGVYRKITHFDRLLISKLP